LLQFSQFLILEHFPEAAQKHGCSPEGLPHLFWLESRREFAIRYA
jgi:hypothetical protein